MRNKIIYLTAILLIIVGCEKKKPDNTVPDLNGKAITALVIDKSNTQWVGTEDGLYKSTSGGYVLENSDITGKILSLGYDGSSTLWVGTTNGLVKMTLGVGSYTTEAIDASNLSNDQVNTVCIDSTMKTWFGTDRGITMNKSGKYKKEYFLTNQLGDQLNLEIETSKINSIADWKGDYYFATTGASLYHAYGYVDSLDAFTGASILGAPYNGYSLTDTMYVVYVDNQGRQWFGGDDGVQVHTGHDTKANNTSYSNELPNKHVHAIAQAPDGKVWFGTEGGIAVFDGNTWTTITNKLPDLFVTAIAFDKDGKAWIGTKKGLVNI